MKNYGFDGISDYSVDVIIPHKNQIGYLKRSLQSIAQQTSPVRSVIVVDDHSHDFHEVARVIQDFQKCFFQLKLVTNAKSGVSSARNMGISVSKSPYIAFLDADDYWYPDKIHNQIRLFKLNSELIANFVGFRIVNTRGDILQNTYAVNENVDAADLLTHKKSISGSASSIMIKRAAVTQCGYFDENLAIGEDFDYWIRLAKYGKIIGIPQILVLITHNPCSTQRSLEEITRLEMELSALSQIISKYPDFLHSSIVILFPILVRLSRLQPIKTLIYILYPFKIIMLNCPPVRQKVKGVSRLTLIWVIKFHGAVLYHFITRIIHRNIAFRIIRKIYCKIKYEIGKRVNSK